MSDGDILAPGRPHAYEAEGLAGYPSGFRSVFQVLVQNLPDDRRHGLALSVRRLAKLLICGFIYLHLSSYQLGHLHPHYTIMM